MPSNPIQKHSTVELACNLPKSQDQESQKKAKEHLKTGGEQKEEFMRQQN